MGRMTSIYMKWKIKMFQTTNQKKKHDAENAWKNDGFLVEYRKIYIYIWPNMRNMVWDTRIVLQEIEVGHGMYHCNWDNYGYIYGALWR